MKTKTVTLKGNKRKNTPKTNIELLEELQKKIMGSNSEYFKFYGSPDFNECMLADSIERQFEEQYDCNNRNHKFTIKSA